MKLRRAVAEDLDRVVALQKAAYAKNRVLLGVEPLPLLADYAEILRTMEVWLAETEGRLDGVLILEPRAEDLVLWSVATDPGRSPSGVGRALLLETERQAREKGFGAIRLCTGTPLVERVAWYQRHGYEVERIEEMVDRSVTHMVKRLPV